MDELTVLQEISSRLNTVNLKLDTLIDAQANLYNLIVSVEQHLFDVSIYLRLGLWIIGICISFYIALWFIKTFVLRLVRQYIKFPI